MPSLTLRTLLAVAAAAATAAVLGADSLPSDARAANATIQMVSNQLSFGGCASADKVTQPMGIAGTCLSSGGYSMNLTCRGSTPDITLFFGSDNCTAAGLFPATPMPAACQDVPVPSSQPLGFGYTCTTYNKNDLLEWVINLSGCGAPAGTKVTVYIVVNKCQKSVSASSSGQPQSGGSYLAKVTGKYPNLGISAQMWSTKSDCSGTPDDTFTASLDTAGTSTCVDGSGSAGAGSGSGRLLAGASGSTFKLLGDPQQVATSGPSSPTSGARELAAGAVLSAAAAIAAVVVA